MNNIYGVDIDTNAVEVTKLSLMLKAMEGETDATISNQLTLLHERVLPTLDNNIKSGNSLIDTDFYDNKIDFEPGAEKKIKPFNWENNFPEVFKQGGFDVVIGNPPWGADLNIENKYLNICFKSNSKDSAAYFIEKAINLSNKMIGFIVPKTISYYSAWKSIREYIIRNTKVINILDAGLAFPEVNLESIVLILNKQTDYQSALINRANPIKTPQIPKNIEILGTFPEEVLKISNVIPFIALNKDESDLLVKLSKNKKVEDIAQNIFRGLYIPDSDKKNFVKGKYNFINKVPDVKRYYIDKILEIDIKDDKWIQKANVIMVPRVFFKVLRGKRILCYPDINGQYLTTEKLVNLVIDKKKYPVSEYFLAGIMNSKLPSFYIQKVLFSDTTETSRVMDRIYMNIIPIPQNPTPEAQNQLVSLVEQMLQLNKDLQKVTLPEQKEQIQARIKYTDNKIDRLVYELYGLTEEEIKIVEGE